MHRTCCGGRTALVDRRLRPMPGHGVGRGHDLCHQARAGHPHGRPFPGRRALCGLVARRRGLRAVIPRLRATLEERHPAASGCSPRSLPGPIMLTPTGSVGQPEDSATRRKSYRFGAVNCSTEAAGQLNDCTESKLPLRDCRSVRSRTPTPAAEAARRCRCRGRTGCPAGGAVARRGLRRLVPA
jgi:hypothetical protein